MSASSAIVDKKEVTLPIRDFSFEILSNLKTEGKTTQEIYNSFSDFITYSTTLECLEKLFNMGLVFRTRSGNTFEWWANGRGIADAAALLLECAAMTPQRDLETICKLSDQNALVASMVRFFSVTGRMDILQVLLHRPMSMNEIFNRILLRVTPSRLGVLLQTLEEFGLISSDMVLVRQEIGGFISKKYRINQKGRIVLGALKGGRPLRDVLKVGVSDETLSC